MEIKDGIQMFKTNDLIGSWHDANIMSVAVGHCTANEKAMNVSTVCIDLNND